MSYESEENIPGKSVLTMGDAAATDAVLRDQLCETLRKQRFKLQTEVSNLSREVPMKIKKDIVKSVKYAQRNEHKNGCEQQDGLERIVKKSASVAATNASHAMLYPSEVSFDDVCKNNAKLGDGAATTTTTTTRIKVTTTIGQGPRDGEEERSHQKVQARLAGFHQYVMENFFKDRKMDGEK